MIVGVGLLRTLASGLLLFVVPGAVLVWASGARPPRRELPAWTFAGSLALLFVSFAITVGLELPLQAALWPLAACVAAIASAGAAARRLGARRSLTAAATATPGTGGHDAREDRASEAWKRERETDGAASRLQDEPRWWPYCLLALAAAAAVAAATMASRGSIDRWWYLAYVRGYLQGDVLQVGEPFLGTGRAFARFGVHPWLMGLALWSKLSGTDPVWLYERIAPLLAVPAAVSAAAALARVLFGTSAAARTAVLATMLGWGGGLLPVLARAGEDKVLAQAALAPLCLAACLSATKGRPGAWVLAAATALATATTHALAFAFLLAAWLPLAALRFARNGRERPALAGTVVLLLLVAVQPALTGRATEQYLSAIGAVAGNLDHPVLRVHESRERTIDVGRLGFVIHPRLLTHPITILALAGLLLVARRRRNLADDFLFVSALVALAVAFLPPLPSLAGKIVPPWMVYRALWILPLGPLAALAVERMRKAVGGGELAGLAAIAVAGAVPLAWSLQQHAGEQRASRALPASPELRAAIGAVSALPPESLIVAAPQLAERLPALTGRHVVAGLDRSTIVFSGTRRRGEARLLARAALLSGDPRARELCRAAALKPTHALFDPRSPARPVCARPLLVGERYALCALDLATTPPPGADTMPASLRPRRGAGPAAPMHSRLSVRRNGGTGPCRASCRPGREGDVAAACRPGQWEATAPVVECSIECDGDDGLAPPAIESVELVPLLGRAVDELLVTARGMRAGRQVWLARGRARADGSSSIRFQLPRSSSGVADAVELRVASGLLPLVKLRDVVWDLGPRPTASVP